MKKILQIPAAAGAILLVGSIAACAQPGTTPDQTPVVTPTKATTGKALPGQPRALPGQQPKKKAPAQARPVDVEPRPFSNNVGEVYEFRAVVDEVWRYCLVFVGGSQGGMHCFDSSDTP